MVTAVSFGFEDADVSPAAPSLNLTPEEKRVFGQLFQQADTENIGVVTGEVAVKFFEKTRLEPRVLGEVYLIFLYFDQGRG
jgi:epidermal growth factor receptor substrate 15